MKRTQAITAWNSISQLFSPTNGPKNLLLWKPNQSKQVPVNFKIKMSMLLKKQILSVNGQVLAPGEYKAYVLWSQSFLVTFLGEFISSALQLTVLQLERIWGSSWKNNTGQAVRPPPPLNALGQGLPEVFSGSMRTKRSLQSPGKGPDWEFRVYFS